LTGGDGPIEWSPDQENIMLIAKDRTARTDGGRWQRATLDRAEWFRPLPSACLDELSEILRILERNPLDSFLLHPDDYPLAATQDFMRGVRQTLETGCGFAVLDRLPIDAISRDQAKQLYWLLSMMIARPVAQAFKGTMLYDVRDIGLKAGAAVRGDLTNEELNWHSDYGYNCPPSVVGLLVLRTARSGGVSGVASFGTVHDQMAARCPELLQRLFEPFIWNRAREHPEGDSPTSQHPVFAREGDTLRARYNPFMIAHGQAIAGADLDAPGQAALEMIGTIMGEPALHCEFVLEPGQIQYVANTRVAHRRTTYEDWPDDDRKRHLVRIFLRDRGRRSYQG